MLGQGLLKISELEEADSQRTVGLNEVRINVQGFLEMVGRGSQITLLKSLLRTLVFLDGFRGNAQLADRN